jgi:anti-sigma B factor antagonist
MSAPRPGEPLQVIESELDGVRLLEVLGELDLASAPRLCARLDAARAQRVRRLVVDVGGLAFCDSTGLRALMGAGAEIRVEGGRFAVVCPDDGPVARLFEVTGMRERLPVYAARSDALAALGRIAG